MRTQKKKKSKVPQRNPEINQLLAEMASTGGDIEIHSYIVNTFGPMKRSQTYWSSDRKMFEHIIEYRQFYEDLGYKVEVQTSPQASPHDTCVIIYDMSCDTC